MLASIAAAPLLPVVGFHLYQARRQFQAGHTLADLRSALEIARRERAESEALVRDEAEPPSRRVLRLVTVASATWLAVTIGLIFQGTIHENRNSIIWFLAPVLSTMLLGAVSNALDVQFIPNGIRDWWQTGVRDRLWNSRAGEWLARRLGAPERSRAVGAGAFRATEAALGVAASELFAALPKAYREQLAELPATVAALEARAADARAEMDVLAALAPSGTADAAVLEVRRKAAAVHLSESVAGAGGDPARPAAAARRGERPGAAHDTARRGARGRRRRAPPRRSAAGGEKGRGRLVVVWFCDCESETASGSHCIPGPFPFNQRTRETTLTALTSPPPHSPALASAPRRRPASSNESRTPPRSRVACRCPVPSPSRR
jgi:hypothetical protein